MVVSSSSSSRTWNPLRLLAMAAATRSIEAVVLGFVIVTLAYFQLLHAVKHSEFLNPSTSSYPASSTFSPDARVDGQQQKQDTTLLARSPGGVWKELSVGSSSEAITLQLNRIVVSLDADLALEEDDRNLLVYPAVPSAPVVLTNPPSAHQESSYPSPSSSSANNATLLDQDTLASLQDFEGHLKSSSYGPALLRYQPELCQRVSPSQECFAASFDHSSDPSGQGRSAMLALGFKPSNEASDWSHQLLSTLPITDFRGYSYLPLSSLHSKRGDAGLGLSFKAFPHTVGLAGDSTSGFEEGSDSRSIKWTLYASRAFVMRFWALAQKADSADIFVMLIGYLLMHLTFINLFINMRKLGSKFWLGEQT